MAPLDKVDMVLVIHDNYDVVCWLLTSTADQQFLSRVSILMRDIDIANLSVRSVCLSVTFRYCMKTA